MWLYFLVALLAFLVGLACSLFYKKEVSLFRDLISKSSDTSSKRFVALWCIVWGTIFGAYSIFVPRDVSVNKIWIIVIFLGSGLAAFGITLFEYKGRLIPGSNSGRIEKGDV
jgi:hypothetical protein